MIEYRVALEIDGEPREAPTTFTDFEAGAAACVRYALQNPGVRARMFVGVADNPIYETHYAVFEAFAPRLEPFMRAAIKRRYGDEPPV
ncbi:MAG: hypothetical protein U0835_00515 [Isosphaeraceae bacterium]